MSNKVKSRKVERILAIGILAALSASAFAGIIVRQPKLELLLKQGEKASVGIVVENPTDSNVEVSAGLADTLNAAGTPVERAASKMIKLYDQKFTVAPKSIKDIKLDIAVPGSAEGGYWTGLMLSYSEGKMAGPDNTAYDIKMNIEVPVNILISDKVRNALTVDKLEAGYSSEEALIINSSISNTGNSFTDVRPYFLVIDEWGKVEANLKPGKIRMYPGDVRQIDYLGAQKFTKGNKTLIAMFDYDGETVKTAEKVFSVK